MTADLRPALFLDRDGVINVDHGYVCTPERTDFIPGIFDLCRAANQQGYLVIIITNQAGIARGLYTENEFKWYMNWMTREFSARGARIDAVYHCPHHPTAGKGRLRAHCKCRKPAPGMIIQAVHDHDVDLESSIFLGDKCTDMQAGKSAGVGKCVLFCSSSFPICENVERIHQLSSLKLLFS